MDNEIFNFHEQINLADFDEFFQHPFVHQGLNIEFTGQVFVEPDWTQTKYYMQVFTKPQHFSHNVLVQVLDSNIMIKANDYVHVKGEIVDIIKSENMIGNDLNAPVIKATSIKVVNYITATYPTLQTTYLNLWKEQHNFEICIRKVELAKEQTRIYMETKNNSEHTVSILPYDTKLLIDQEEYQPKFIYNPVLPEIPTDIMPHSVANGVLFFPGISQHIENFTMHIEGSFRHSNLEFSPFIFDVIL